MKKTIIALLFVFMAVSLASAEVLGIGATGGAGKWSVGAFGLQNQNVSGNLVSDLTATAYGVAVGYGLTDALDAQLSYTSATYGGSLSSAGLASASATLPTLTLKYGVMDEKKGAPASVALVAGYEAISYTGTAIALLGGGTTNSSGSQIKGGVVASKYMIPFVPYGGLIYRSNSGDTGTSTQIDLTVGTAFTFSAQTSAALEYTLQSITSGGTTYSSGQIALGVGQNL